MGIVLLRTIIFRFIEAYSQNVCLSPLPPNKKCRPLKNFRLP